MKAARFASVVLCTLPAFALCLFAPWFTGHATAQTKVVKIGLVSSVTGPMAPAFKSEVVAAKPAADFLNAKGGLTIKGQKYRIEVVTADDQSSPPGAVSAANKLLQEGVKYVISPMFVPNDMAIAPICEQAKVLRMCPNRTEPAPFALPNKYSFCAEATIYYIGPAYGRITALYPNVKRVAILKPDDPGVKSASDAVEKEIKRRGLDIVFNEAYKIGTEDFYPILTKLLEAKPDSIECIFSILPWAKGIINQSRELGFTGPISAVSAGFGDTDMLQGMLDPKYAYDVCHAMPDVASPKNLPIVKEYGKVVEMETKEKVNFDHVLTLQALWVIVQGMEQAQSFDTDKVAAALESMKSIETPYGKGRFGGKELTGNNRLMVKEVPFTRMLKGGKIEYELLPVK